MQREAAIESIVLLKNDTIVLPLSTRIDRTIAVIGADATEARLGGYTGPGNDKVNILDGIKKRPRQNVLYTPGAAVQNSNETIPRKIFNYNGRKPV